MVFAVLIWIVGVTDPPTVITISLEVAVVVVAQLAFEVNTQVTLAPLVKALLVKVAPVPAFTPFTFH